MIIKGNSEDEAISAVNDRRSTALGSSRQRISWAIVELRES
jgi:hypothetical protein